MVLSTALHFLTSQRAKNQVKLEDWFPCCKTGKISTSHRPFKRSKTEFIATKKASKKQNFQIELIPKYRISGLKTIISIEFLCH
jgi:hypothetical protein